MVGVNIGLGGVVPKEVMSKLPVVAGSEDPTASSGLCGSHTETELLPLLTGSLLGPYLHL